MSTELIKIISLSYNLISKEDVVINEGDFIISLYKTPSSDSVIRVWDEENSKDLFVLLLEETFKWGEFRVNHIDLLGIYDMDETSIILILSKKVLNHNLMGRDIDKETLEKYSKVIEILSRKLQSLK